ncbi:MAG: two-component regulator propeller domain-containing protein [Bacteroidota bacterium]|nr:two-component regulator propeller domain-containing protein [Bacteroidota bacterium]
MSKYYFQVIFILFVLTSKLFSQTFKKIGVEDGLPSSIVYDIKVDKHNRIWIATFGGGIACYDGIKFNVLNSDMGLNNDLIRNISLDETTGNIYVGSQGAFELISKDTIHNLDKILNDTTGSNVLLTSVVGNTIYTSTQDGFITLVNLKKQNVIKKANAIAYLIDDDKNLWLPCRNKLYVRQANGHLIDFKLDLNINIEGISDIKKFKKNIIISTKNGLYIFDKFKLVNIINKQNGLNQDFIRCLLVDDTTLWLGTKHGLLNTTNLKNFNIFDSKNGIDQCEIKCMCLDKNGLLWLGSSTNGVFRMIKSNIIKYNFNAEPIAFTKDKENNVYALTKNAIKVFNKDSNNFVTYLPLKGFENLRHFCIDKNKAIYLTQGEKGVVKITPPNTYLNFEYKMDRTDNPAMSLLNDNDYIWMGYKRRLLRYNINTHKIDSLKQNEGFAYYFQDIIRSDSTVWLTTDRGLTRYFKNKFYEVTHKNNKNFPEGITNSIKVDKYKHLWIAADKGLFCVEGDETFSNYRKDYFPTNEIWDIAIIDTFLFAATNKGLIQVAIKPKNNKNCIYQIINKRNGLVDFDLTDKAIFSDSTNVWIAHENGAYRYKPGNQLKLEIPIYISNVYNDFGSLVFRNSKNFTQQIVEAKSPLNLSYDENDFTIEFKGINYNLLDNVFYSYRLVGLNSNWSIPSNETKAVYTNLNPGKYVFELSESNGKINFGKPISYTIYVHPPFYLTWWFKTLIVLIIIISVLTFIQLRIKNIKKKNALLENKVNERTKQLNLKSQELENTNTELIYKEKLITESLEYAKKIQESILPSESYLDTQFKTIVKTASIYLPKDLVSGDFYYAYKKNNFNYFALVDCTGHGVPGALLSFSVNSILHGIMDNITEFKEPSVILKKLLLDFSEIYVKGQDVKESFAISLICYDSISKTIHFSGISQSIVLYTNNTIKEIKTENSFLFTNSAHINDIRFPVNKGDRLYLYSDGFYDQKSEQTKKRMYKSGMINKIDESKSLSLINQITDLKNFYINFKGSHQQIDDSTLFAIEIV